MAVSKKNSRNISVGGHDFKWRATGNDGWISVVVWPVENDDSRAVATVGYHQDWEKVNDSHYTLTGQLIVTNRIVRELILYVGVENFLGNKGQINVGAIEEFYDVSKAIL